MSIGINKKPARALALIPARGGSKRIPRKNIKPFAGKPIIHYSIQSALKSDLFDEVMVSTDDQEIAEVARQGGANVPFMRSEATSTDTAILIDVVKEVLDTYSQAGRQFDFVCCILPTAPFITAQALIEGFDKLQSTQADSLVPIVRFSFPIQRAFKLDAQGGVQWFYPELFKMRSQDLEPAYHDIGQFYWIRTEKFLEKSQIVTDNTAAMIVPDTFVQDIDTDEDWNIAELKYRFAQDAAVSRQQCSLSNQT